MATTYEGGIPLNQPRVCILRTDGTNCDEETAYAFSKAGGRPHLVHVNELRSNADSLRNYAILAIPGGFSYGDDIASGVVWANELISFLRDQLQGFVSDERLILGICNGFQVLVRTGLLPLQTMRKQQAVLTSNDSGRFECRWVELFVIESSCVFTAGLAGQRLELPVAHGEGKFVAPPAVLRELEVQQLGVLTYADKHTTMTANYPANPNGSAMSVAGVCDPTGRIFGLMPHPERFVEPTQHPNWRRLEYGKPHGLAIFENAVRVAADL